MAALKILRPPVCGDSAREVPRAQWSMLIEERVNFCKNVLPSDCRLLLFFVEDAERAGWMGFESRDAYLRNGLRLDPEMVELALRGLELSDPNKKTALDHAVVLGKHGGARIKSEQGDNITLDRGTSANYTLARLDRDHPELAERVRDGKLSANAAAIEAGFRRKPTPFEQIERLIPRLTDDERRQIRAML